MNRKDFLQLSALGVAGIILPFSFTRLEKLDDDYSINELIGKAKLNLYGNGFNLRKEAADALNQMNQAAKKDGHSVHVISSYRSYNHQNSIWVRKYKKYRNQGFSHKKTIQKIILYSTIPGTSRHHWGTDLDIIDGKVGVVKNPLHEKHFNKGGAYHKFKNWLDDYATDFGFYEVYTNNPERKGFAYEPWHFSYRPLSCQMLEEYKLLDLKSILQQQSLMGSDNFSDSFIEKYRTENVLGINDLLL